MRPASVFSSIQLLNSRTHFRKMDRFLTQIFFLYYSKQYPVFDSWEVKKSLYPLYLLGCSDFCRCHEI